jgi:hypothetical protein
MIEIKVKHLISGFERLFTFTAFNLDSFEKVASEQRLPVQYILERFSIVVDDNYSTNFAFLYDGQIFDESESIPLKDVKNPVVYLLPLPPELSTVKLRFDEISMKSALEWLANDPDFAEPEVLETAQIVMALQGKFELHSTGQ